jgi:hypothetical protein
MLPPSQHYTGSSIDFITGEESYFINGVEQWTSKKEPVHLSLFGWILLIAFFYLIGSYGGHPVVVHHQPQHKLFDMKHVTDSPFIMHKLYALAVILLLFLFRKPVLKGILWVLTKSFTWLLHKIRTYYIHRKERNTIV